MRFIAPMCLLISFSIASVVIHEPELCCGWRNDFGTQISTKVILLLHCREENVAKLKQFVMEVSNPSHPNYGKYLSQTEVDAWTAPSIASINTVHAWLYENAPNSTIQITRGRTLSLSLSTSKAESLLSTKFRGVTNTITGQRALRAGHLTLPAEVFGALDAISGLHGLPLPPKTSFRNQSLGANKAGVVTPEVISSTYDVRGVPISGTLDNRQAVAEFLEGNTMNTTDLETFFKMFVPNKPANTVSKFVGANGTGVGGLEPSLDIQYVPFRHPISVCCVHIVSHPVPHLVLW